MNELMLSTVRMLLPILAVWLTAAPVLAQSKTGTTVGQFLLIEPSARIAGMGNAGVSVPGGLDAAYYNPAAAASEDRIAIHLSHSLWLADINYDHVAAVFPIGRWGGSILASLTALGSGDIEVRTVTQPLGTGERYQVSDLAIGIGYARSITDRFSAGARVSYVQETIWNSSVHAATLDFGTLFALADNGLHIGASLSHFGTRGRFDGRDLHILYDNDPTRFGDNSALPGQRYTDDFPVPVLFRVGLGLPVQLSPNGRLMLVADAFHPSDNTESVSFGAEFQYRDIAAVRLGYQNLFLEDSEVGLTAGAGVQGDIDAHSYRFDYAWADHGRLGDTHRISLGFIF
jgi:hypothetical protein